MESVNRPFSIMKNGRLCLNEAGQAYLQEELERYEYQPIKLLIKVHWRCYIHCRGCAEDEDINAACILGFAEAVARYDPDKKIKFDTYASQWVRSISQREILGGTFTDANKDQVRKQWWAVKGGMSLDRDVDDNATIGSFIGHEPDSPDLDSSEIWSRVSSRLDPVQSDLLYRRFVLGESYKGIAVTMNKSKERIRQIVEAALHEARTKSGFYTASLFAGCL